MMDKSKLISMLYKIYDGRESVQYNELIETLNAIKINSVVNYLVYHEKLYDDNDKELMVIIVKILQDIYNNSELDSPITDELYDQLYAAMISADEHNIVGADVSSNKILVNHMYPDLRGTLDKVHFIYNAEKPKNEKRKSIADWIVRNENKINRRLTHEESEVILFPKFDGVSVIFECDKNGNVERALTRGNTAKNEASLIPLFAGLKMIPYEPWQGSPFAVKSEVVMTDNNFKKYCKKYGAFKSRRSAVSSIINNDEPKIDFLRYITIVPLRMQNFSTGEIIIHPDAFKIYPNVKTNLNNMGTFNEVFINLRNYVEEMMGIPCDGVVIHMTDNNMHNLLGREEAINKYEVAYKFPPLGCKTILKDVEFSVGTLGSITPVAKVEPVIMCGNTIRSISLGSVDRFESLHLRKGDEVIVKYEIIPYLTKDPSCKESDNEIIKAPTHCSYCDEELVNDPVLRCVNSGCPCRMIGHIVNYLNKLDILNVSEGIVTALFNLGVLRSIEDLYKLKNHKNTIINTPGFGDKSYEIILKAVKSRKTVKDYELLGALGIKNVSAKKFKRISFIYYIDEIQEICNKGEINKLIDIKGIEEKTANAIMIGIINNEDLIEFLKHELTIIPTKGVEDSMVVLFSKVSKKDEFTKFLKGKGINVVDSYNKDVSLLIVPSKDATSSKIEKAKKDGKEIITIDEAYSRFNYKG